MPQVAAGAVLAGLAGGFTILPWGAISVFSAAGFFKAFATSIILGGLSRALAPKPKKPAFTQNVQQTTVASRQPTETRKHVYGHTRVADIYAHMEGNETSGKLHLFLIVSASEVTAIDEIWANDYAIPNDWIDANGNVTQGRYAGKLRIRKHLGGANQAADSVAVSELPEWTNEHRLRGVAYIYITATKDQDVFPNGLPNFSAVVRGKKLTDPRTGETSFSTNVALFCHDYLNVAKYGFENKSPDLDNIASEANICDEIVTTQSLAINATAIDTATNIITLEGDINRLQYGDRVRISGSVIPTGLLADTDYYAIIYQVKDTPRIMLATTLQNAMNSVAINITSAGTSVVITKTGEPRYHGAGVLDTGNSLEDNMWDLVNSMAGRAIYVGGLWRLLAGAYRAPSIAYDVGDFIGNISTRPKIPMSERFNVIKGLYTSSVTNYQPDSYPQLRVQGFVEQDNNIEYPRELNLPYTNRSTTAQRIAKIELLKSRQEIVFTAPCTMKGMLSQVGDTIEVSIDRYGWANKEFEVTGFAFSVGEDGNLTTSLTTRETAEAVYDWTSSEDILVDPAPNTSLPSAFNVNVPTGVAFSSRKVETVAGDELYNLVLQWTLHDNIFVREFGDFEIQFKQSSDSEWRASFFVDGSLTQADIIQSSVNVAYDLRIRARNNLGVRSNYVTITGALVGSSGGVGTTNDWGDFTAHSASIDWGDFATAASSFEDWETFT
jgi:hypothetical protein